MNPLPVQTQVTVAAIRVSRHALQRTRKRIHWNRSAAEKMAFRALTDGIGVETCQGPLRQYLLSRIREEGEGFPKIHGEFVYIFVANGPDGPPTLKTVYRAPGEVIRAFLRRSPRWACSLSSGDN